MRHVVLRKTDWTRISQFFFEYFFESQFGVEPRGHSLDKLADGMGEVGNVTL